MWVWLSTFMEEQGSSIENSIYCKMWVDLYISSNLAKCKPLYYYLFFTYISVVI